MFLRPGWPASDQNEPFCLCPDEAKSADSIAFNHVWCSRSRLWGRQANASNDDSMLTSHSHATTRPANAWPIPVLRRIPSRRKKDCFVACASRNDGSQQKGPRKLRGPFRHFDFRDSDLMRSSSFKNSAVSSAIVLGGGLGGKGITSDIGRTSRDASPRGGSFLPCNWRVSAAKYSPKRATAGDAAPTFRKGLSLAGADLHGSSCRFRPPSRA